MVDFLFFRSEPHVDIEICICFLSELYFLIAKFLSAGPCKKASEVSEVLVVVFITNILHYLTDIPLSFRLCRPNWRSTR